MVGVTMTIVRSPRSFCIGADTAATPGMPSSSSVTPVMSCFCCPRSSSGASTTTVSGPLKPGPKPSVSRSYERRSVVDSGWEPPSGRPSFMCVAGTAAAPSRVRPTSSTGSGRAVTKRAQRRLSGRRVRPSPPPGRYPSTRLSRATR